MSQRCGSVSDQENDTRSDQIPSELNSRTVRGESITKARHVIALKQIGEHSESGAYHDCEIGQEEEEN